MKDYKMNNLDQQIRQITPYGEDIFLTLLENYGYKPNQSEKYENKDIIITNLLIKAFKQYSFQFPNQLSDEEKVAIFKDRFLKWQKEKNNKHISI